VSAKAIANLLALSDERDRAIMMYFNIDDDRFEVQMHCNGPISFFNRFNGLYVYDLEETQSFAMVSTVEERKKRYKKREIKAAEDAKELLRKMGLPSVASLVKLINSGSILNCPVTAHDVLRAQDIWGPDIGSLKGKTTTHRRDVVKIEPLKKIFQVEQSMHLDLMFIEGHNWFQCSYHWIICLSID
jgi:hypothetical protein